MNHFNNEIYENWCSTCIIDKNTRSIHFEMFRSESRKSDDVYLYYKARRRNQIEIHGCTKEKNQMEIVLKQKFLLSLNGTRLVYPMFN